MDTQIRRRTTMAVDENNTSEPPQPALPRYQLDQAITAVQIHRVEVFTDYCNLHHGLEGIRPLVETLAWHNIHRPQPGEYYVEDEAGDTRMMAAAVFEASARAIA